MRIGDAMLARLAVDQVRIAIRHVTALRSSSDALAHTGITSDRSELTQGIARQEGVKSPVAEVANGGAYGAGE